MPSKPHSKSEERRLEQQKEDTEVATTAASTDEVAGETAVEDDGESVFKDAAEAKIVLKRDATFGERRADGEIEGVTVNVDQYQGPRFENLHAQYRESELAASRAGQASEDNNE